MFVVNNVGWFYLAYSLQELLRNETATVLVTLLLLGVLAVSILGLEVLDQGVDVLIFVVRVLGLGLRGRGGLVLGVLLVEVAGLNLRVQRRRAVFGHCEVTAWYCKLGFCLNFKRQVS